MHYKDIERIVSEIMPKDCEVTRSEPEGLSTVIYLKNIKSFYSNDQLIRQLAGALKKKVTIRVDPSMLMEVEDAKKLIEQTIPEEAGLKSIRFVPEMCEVHIEALKPGLVIGKGGMVLKDIMLKTGWAPIAIRAPTMPSVTLDGVRKIAVAEAADRKKFLLNIGKKICQPSPSSDWIRLVSLGGFREIGRSCMLVQSQNSKILMDVGVNTATWDPTKAYPYMNMMGFSISDLDAVVISHGHMDHMGFLPYLFAYGYDGPVYCTPPTRDLMVLLQQDYINLTKKAFNAEPIYSKKDIHNELRHIITVDYGEVVDITPEIKMTLYNAGHIIGSAAVHLHIGEGAHNLVYSGDQKFGFTRLFDPATTRFPRVETLLIESTYGGRSDFTINRFDSEKNLSDLIKTAIDRRGKVLIPVFAVGRSQEILLVLEDYYRRNPDFNVPVYIDGMVLEASAIHTAYPEFLREQLMRRILSDRSPFESPMIKVAKGTDKEEIVNGEPCIILAPSGMLAGGPSLEYLKMMADDEKNLLIFVGYQSALSLGSKIQRGQTEIPTIGDDGKTKMINIKMQVATAEGFSVPYDTQIMIRQNGEFRLVEVGKIADDYIAINDKGVAAIEGIEVPSFESDGTIEWKKASHIIKHKRKEKHIKIKTKSGKEIQVSKGHSLFTLKNAEVKTITGGELSENDYIVIPNKLPESHSIHSIDFSSMVDYSGYSINENTSRFEPINGGNQVSFLNTECKDMDSLARFLGYYIAEGHIDKGEKHCRAVISFGTHEKGLVDDLKACVEKIFGVNVVDRNPHPTEIQLLMNNKLLVQFLEKIGVGKGAKNKRVPAIVFNFDQQAQKEFLKGYFAGDGYDYKTGGKGYLAAKSASKMLISDLSYLLLQHGIVSRIKGPYIEKERMLNGNLLKESIVYKIYIAEKEFEKIDRNVGYPPFSLPIKEIGLTNWYKKIDDPKLRKLAEDYTYTMKKGRKHIGLGVLRKLINGVNSPEIKTLRMFTDGHLALDQIISIEEGEDGEFEYDISVPGTENFVGGIGGIMLHNSGHSDRSQLMAYLKNLRPTPERVITLHGDWGKTEDFARSASMALHKEGRAMANLEAIRLR